MAAVVSKGELGCARFLIEYEADPNNNIEFGEYKIVLAAAIIGSHELAVIKFLVEEERVDLSQLSVDVVHTIDTVAHTF